MNKKSKSYYKITFPNKYSDDGFYCIVEISLDNNDCEISISPFSQDFKFEPSWQRIENNNYVVFKLTPTTKNKKSEFILNIWIGSSLIESKIFKTKHKPDLENSNSS